MAVEVLAGRPAGGRVGDANDDPCHEGQLLLTDRVELERVVRLGHRFVVGGLPVPTGERLYDPFRFQRLEYGVELERRLFP